MTLIWRAVRRAPTCTRSIQQERRIADVRPFFAGDHVILRPTNDRSATPVLSRSLRPGRRIDTHKGVIPHEDIIGKRVRDVIRTATTKAGKQGVEYRLHEVKLEEYVRLTKRLVTPLYPQDARLIVGLLDLHPDPPAWGQSPDEPKLEILEAGTGHGALTLFLSRAIHAANPLFPRETTQLDDEGEAAVQQWKATRRALIHTIEISPKYSAHAQKVVQGFRHGTYHHNVDFHVGNVSDWTRAALKARHDQPFLSHAFLDLPGAETHLGTVASALRTDGTLIAFNPSITQIMAALEKVKDDKVPLELERVIELGVNGGSGGREWDVRAVRPRASLKAASMPVPACIEGESVVGAAVAAEDSGVELSRDEEPQVAGPSTETEGKNEWKMVCRPKVGDAIVGGGFLGVFRKLRDMREVAGS
ncbi:hypothetical protein LTR36_001247 [Oleoguttula mirabilis]|uniref:tRNA (adenine(58)-N(1))-methyltransferase catalytic subunit TRM61 n=1 Tax=Oleoguttula mirabilis TaxID=1507867 RepID=A0AAV9JPU7_9PEZI|nr:hypothetical protein LTR36_001247 [Oleoguttula mirabilis]